MSGTQGLGNVLEAAKFEDDALYVHLYVQCTLHQHPSSKNIASYPKPELDPLNCVTTMVTLTFSTFWIFLCMYFVRHCFICRPSDSTVPEYAGIEPRTRRSSHWATSHPLLELYKWPQHLNRMRMWQGLKKGGIFLDFKIPFFNTTASYAATVFKDAEWIPGN